MAASSYPPPILIVENPFAEPDIHRTLALKVEGVQFWISKEQLAGYSPVFKKMLYSDDFIEAGKTEIPLPEKKFVDILELLRCLFPMPRMKGIDMDNIDLLLEFADEYNIDDIVQRAESFLRFFLTKCSAGDEMLLRVIRIGSKWKMLTFLKECIPRCAMEFQIDRLQPLFEELRSEVIAGLMIGGKRCQYRAGGGNVCATHNPRVRLLCAICGQYSCPECSMDQFCKGFKTGEMLDMLLARLASNEQE